MTEVFIAYEFPDPWVSRMIDVDADFEVLCRRLADKRVLVTPYGPVIYRCEANKDPQLHGRPLAAWCGQHAGGDWVVSPIGEHGDTSELMISVTDFVWRFLDEHVQGVRSGDDIHQDGEREVVPSGSGSSEGDRGGSGDEDREGGKRFCPSFLDVPER